MALADPSISVKNSPDQINVVIQPVEEAAGGKHWLVTQTTVRALQRFSIRSSRLIGLITFQDWEAFLEQYNGNDAQIIEEDESAADSGTVSGVYRSLRSSDFLSGD
jgi:hypothetical protein